MHDLKRVLLKARRQAGVVSRLQLLKMGFSSAAVGRAVADGVLRSMLPGVYCVSTAADPVQTRLWAAALWGGPGACLSHLALEQLGRRGRAGAGKLATLATAQDLGPSASPLEVDVRRALADAGLPQPMPQWAAIDADGEQIAIVDFAWPQKNLVLFVHSRLWHSTPRAVERDFSQASDLAAAGYTVLTVTTQRLRTEPQRFIEQVRRILLAR